ncbi:esterase/lipase superfamily enzyme [Rhizobium leguminosarum]|uniref:Esterase/lipase superfamily enzyme n=2 Tax=Rhizobium/Agrobacterium group TaxID=227290 RepID=A0AAE2MIW5_RHILE|nr:esterase/lipase superfamily enzyme [Rhizobium leguminosarum]MBB4431006.1 esterase/lipase superfamily enzyme [Rhizobium esperanzae]MBB4296548.1 esterase/lipase superfamily enzyme [Rhizobium leguminosarum]MBB4308191.1 esterase/lipase superfamily enzyme [Rhizobium leguminosarum]MBB4416027.1 esterase/lipase superfamily enzyme [Rhizobium leguminosarum]
MASVSISSSTPPTSRVDMLVATTREPSGNPATLFNGERSSKPHLTQISVSIPAKREAGTVQWPKRLPPDPATDFAVTNVQQIDTIAQGRVWFRQHVNGGHALVFIHGLNNTYEDSVFRLAQIVHDSKMQAMGIRDGHVNSKIHNVILASPDIDIQVFAKQYVEMGEPRPKFTIFVSQDDKALAVSSFLTGRVSRLGAINPAEEPYRSKLEKAGITAIDLTKVKTNDRLNHGKFAESPEIVQLIGQRLMTGQPLTDSKVTLGQGITAVVGGTVANIGTVAATAVAVPVAIIEQPITWKRPPRSANETLDGDLKQQTLTQ